LYYGFKHVFIDILHFIAIVVAMILTAIPLHRALRLVSDGQGSRGTEKEI